MTDLGSYAARIAPEIDRTRIAIARGIRDRGEPMTRGWGLTASATMVVAMLRNAPPGRTVTFDQLDAVFVYQAGAEVRAGLDHLLSLGLLERLDDGVALTGRGGDLLGELYQLGSAVVDELWAGHEDLCEVLLPLAGRVVEAAVPSGGPAFSLLAPPLEPDDARPPMLLAERLTPLRFHRFDAHVAAWRAAGLSADEMAGLEDGPVREAVEAATNRQAGVPYAALGAAERATLLEGLRALPG